MLNGSVQSRGVKVQELPLASILRPITPVLDQAKIDSMVQTLKHEELTHIPTPAPESMQLGELPPVDILQYKAPDGKLYNFGFGGCHRFQAYEKAGIEMVSCKVLKVTRKMLRLYLGGSVDSILGAEES